MALYQYDILSTTLSGKYITGLFGDNNHAMPLPDYFLLNFTASVRFGDFELFTRLQNLLDRKYYVYRTDNYDYPAPGFHALAGVRWGM